MMVESMSQRWNTMSLILKPQFLPSCRYQNCKLFSQLRYSKKRTTDCNCEPTPKPQISQLRHKYHNCGTHKYDRNLAIMKDGTLQMRSCPNFPQYCKCDKRLVNAKVRSTLCKCNQNFTIVKLP